jgi:hypothetical protein
MITVFLSHSSKDRLFVQQVYDRLPAGIAHFYQRTFDNGEYLIKAMEERIEQSAIFALFASRASVISDWVNFEIDRARIQQIKNKKFRLLVFIIDRSLDHAELPSWMSEYWIPNCGYSSRDVSRYLRSLLLFQGVLDSRVVTPYGRGGLIDLTVRRWSESILINNRSPNVLIFSGVNGIGRRTVARMFLEKALPNSYRGLLAGPEFELPHFADLDDIFRAVSQELDSAFSVEKFSEDLVLFRQMDVEQRVHEILSKMSHFFELGQSVILVSDFAIFEDRGTLKTWAPLLFSEMARLTGGALIMVNARQIHPNELKLHPNVLQFNVPELHNEDIKAIIIAILSESGKKVALPSDDVIRAIGGHPAVAKMAGSLFVQLGSRILDDDPTLLHPVQDEVISKSLDITRMSGPENEALSILSWVPSLPAHVLSNVIRKRHAVESKGFADMIGALLFACFISVTGDVYSINSAIRAYFRRQYGHGNEGLQKDLFDELTSEWERSHRKSETPVELFDAFAFMSALEGGSLPPPLRDLMLPSSLQSVIRETYNSGHEDKDALERVVSWGSPAQTLIMDEATRQEILSYVIRALIRLRDRDHEVDNLLDLFRKRAYRSYYYLNGFYLRRRGKPRAAISFFQEARAVGKYRFAVVGELADCFKVLGMWDELRELIHEEKALIDRNPYLLDIYVGMLIAARDWPNAEAAIRRLRAAGKNDGRADCKLASIMMHRDGKYRDAKELLTNVLLSARSGRDNIRRMRAFAAAFSNDLKTARSDLAHLIGKLGEGEGTIRIEATILLVERKFDDALLKLAEIRAPTAQDELLNARIMEAKANDSSTSLVERDKLRQQAVMLRARFGTFDEFDVGQ